MTEIGQKITLTLEFEVVERKENMGCSGCAGDLNDKLCIILPCCEEGGRPDKKDVIFKLIENDATPETNH